MSNNKFSNIVIYTWIIGIFYFLTLNLGCAEIKRHKTAKEGTIGTYRVELSISTICIDSVTYDLLSDLTLKLNNDGNFKFSKLVPEICDSFGTWKVEGYGEVLNIHLRGSNESFCQFTICCGNNNDISTVFKNNENLDCRKFGRLHFIKYWRKKD